MNNRIAFESACGVAGGIAGFMLGAKDGLFFALAAFVVLDYLTGIIGAILKKKLSSRVGFDGIFKKIMVFVLVALANIIDVQVLGGGGGILRSAVIAFFLANEGLSVLENVADAGLPVPKKLKSILEQLRKENDENGE